MQTHITIKKWCTSWHVGVRVLRGISCLPQQSRRATVAVVQVRTCRLRQCQTAMGENPTDFVDQALWGTGFLQEHVASGDERAPLLDIRATRG